MARHAVLIGIGEYQDRQLRALRSVESDLDRLQTEFADPSAGAFDQVHLIRDPTARDLKVQLGEILTGLTAADFVLIYLSCHGVKDERFDDLHFACADTLLADPAGTGVADRFVQNALHACRAAGKVLLLDCCYSGLYSKDRVPKAGAGKPLDGSALAGDSAVEAAQVRGSAVITACNEYEYAFEIGADESAEAAHLDAGPRSAFTVALLDVLADPATDTDRDGWLTATEVHTALGARMAAAGSRQTPIMTSRSEGQLRVAKARRAAWIDPAFVNWAGSAEAGATALERHFTGRVPVLQDLVRSITAPPPGQSSLLLVGGPGSGKSAIVGRLVTLADPVFRESADLGGEPVDAVPPAGCIDVAVYAAGLSTAAIESRIGVAIFGEESPRDLVHRLLDPARIRSRPVVTIVIDAADEATEPVGLAVNLLTPLIEGGGRCGIRLVVAARTGTEILHNLSVDHIIDLDRLREPPTDDLRSYALALLSAPGSPYYDHPQQAAVAAAAVADRAVGNFLVGKSLASALATAARRAEPEELHRLPSRLSHAMRKYLYEVGCAMRRRGWPDVATDEAADSWLKDLLLPLAYVRGPGMPDDELWAAVATRIGLRAYTVHDIRQLRASAAGAFIRIAGIANGERTWALFHQTLAEQLREAHGQVETGARRKVSEAFATELQARVPRRDGVPAWAEADQYTLFYLAGYAEGAGTFSGLLADLEYLVYADKSVLQQIAASQVPVFGEICSAIAHHRLVDAPDARRQLLLATLLQSGRRDLAARLRRPAAAGEMRWRARWATGRKSPAHTGLIWSMAGHRVDDRYVVVTGSGDGTAKVWDVLDGRLLHTFEGDHREVYRVACADLADGTPIAVTVGSDSTAQVWNLRTFELVCEFVEHTDQLFGVLLAEVAGLLVAITTSDDLMAYVWDPATGEPLGRLSGHIDRVQRAAVSEIHGQPVAVTVSDDATAVVWELGDAGVPSTPRATGPSASQQARDYGSGHYHGVLAHMVGHQSALYKVECLTADGRSFAVTTGLDTMAFVWDLESEEPWLELVGHDAAITDVRCVSWRGHPLAVTASEDGTVRVWSLRDGSCHRVLRGHTDEVVWAVPRVVDGQLLITSSSSDATLLHWDAGSGKLLSATALPGDCATFVLLPDGALAATFGEELAVVEPVTGPNEERQEAP